MAMVGEDASIKAIRDHRLANPAITQKHNLSTDPGDIKRELTAFQQARGSLPKPQPSFFRGSPSSQSRSKGAAAAASTNWFQKIIRTGTGVSTLGDWLGHGGNPVEKDLSEKRALVCADCPMNAAKDLVSFFTVPTANLILRQLEERKQLNLSTAYDDKLGVCGACGCPLKLKVHTPINFIVQHMGPTEKNSLDPRCWILKNE